MTRRRIAVWMLSIPLMLVGSQVAHGLAYWLVYPQSQLRVRALLLSGHSYMNFGVSGFGGYLPMLIGCCGALELVACGWVVAARSRGRRHAPVPPTAFALLPLLGFSLQEFLERWFAGAPFPWWMVLQPTFRIGLLLQVPLALAAFLLARLLLGAVDGLGRRLRQAAGQQTDSGLAPVWHVLPAWPPVGRVLAAGHAGRAPPLLRR